MFGTVVRSATFRYSAGFRFALGISIHPPQLFTHRFYSYYTWMTLQQNPDLSQPQGCVEHTSSGPLHYVANPPIQRAWYPPKRQQGALNSYIWILFHTWFPILFLGLLLQSDLSISPGFHHFRLASCSYLGISNHWLIFTLAFLFDRYCFTEGVAGLASSSWRHYTIVHSF